MKKNDRRGANGVDVETGRPSELDVREPVRERERELLRGGAARFADVVAGDRDRVPAGHLGLAEPDRVGDDPHRRPGREDELLLRLVLLEDVVLERAAQRARGVPCRSALATNIASRIAAGPLIVIDVVTEPASMPR